MFGSFYRQHATEILRFFARRLLESEAALDLTAETFAQAYAGRGRFRGSTEEEARAWLFVIAQRQLAGYLRRGYAKQEAISRLALERPAATTEELQRIEDLAAVSELRTLVAHQVGQLPEGMRAALTLRVIEELGYPEVASRLSITETAARMRVSRALAELRGAIVPATAERIA